MVPLPDADDSSVVPYDDIKALDRLLVFMKSRSVTCAGPGPSLILPSSQWVRSGDDGRLGIRGPRAGPY